MRTLYATLVLLALAASSKTAFGESWEQHTLDLSGRILSVSAPKGHFRDEYLPRVDLSANEKPYITLLKKSWVFSGFIADQGGLDFIVGLNRAELGSSEQDFLQGVQNHLSAAYRSLRPEGIQIQNVTKRRLGGREWLCYSASNLHAECALRIDARYYVSWVLQDINNSSSQIRARDRLRTKIEESLKIAF